MMEKRGRSPSLRRKNSIEQQSISPDLYSVVEQKKLLTSAELKKVPIYSKYTVSSLLYAQNVKRPHSFDKTSKSPRRSVDKPPIALSKVIPTKTKSNEDNLSSSYTKPSSPKPGPEDTNKKPHPRNYVNAMESNVKSQKQPTKGFGSKTVDADQKKLRFHDDLLSSKDDHNLTTYEKCDKITSPSESNDILIVEEDRDNQLLVEDLHGEMESQKGDKILRCELLVPICLEGNADMPQSNTCSNNPDNVMVVESVNNEHLNDHNDETNQQDQACETFDAGGDHLTHPNVDKENQKTENEQEAQDQVVDIGSKVFVEDEGRKRKEPEVKEGGEDVAPNKEDLISKMVVAYQQVVAHGKKDIATYNSVTEETISKLREQRSNKVKALVGAFESVISHEYDVLPKRLFTHQ